MRKLITSIVLAIVVLLAIVQFAPSVVFGQEQTRVKACPYHGQRIAAALIDRAPGNRS